MGGNIMSSTENRDKLERIRRAKNGEEDIGAAPEIFTCPVEGCSRVVIDNPGDLRNHVRQEVDGAHRGLRLNPALELVERYKIESDLREQYVEKEKSQQEIADEWGCTRSTIQRWMNRHEIPRRSGMGGGANRVEYASFYTETHENGGYEKVGAYDPEREGMVWTTVHQLVAIAQGENPEKVFSDGEYQTHHRTGIPFDNRRENVELLRREVHQRAHQRDEWTEDDGFPVLVTGQPLSEEEYHATWGPGVSSTDSEQQDEEEDLWAPGPLKSSA